jgi:hypothetical protein
MPLESRHSHTPKALALKSSLHPCRLVSPPSTCTVYPIPSAHIRLRKLKAEAKAKKRWKRKNLAMIIQLFAGRQEKRRKPIGNGYHRRQQPATSEGKVHTALHCISSIENLHVSRLHMQIPACLSRPLRLYVFTSCRVFTII